MPYTRFITAPALPCVSFESVEALSTFCSDALAAEQAISDFQRDRDEIELSNRLAHLAFDAAEIAAIIKHPTRRPCTLYSVL